MKKTILALFFAAVSISQAAFISFTTGGGRGHAFVLNDGVTRVAVGSTVRVGYLSVAGDASSFVEFATTTIANPLSSAPIGGFITDKTGDNPNVNPIKNQQVALWVTGQGGQQAVFTSAGWVVPSSIVPDTDSGYSVVLGVNNNPAALPVVTALNLPGYTGAGFESGRSITVTTGTNPTGSIYTLGVPVPEPGVSILALASLGLLARRRRN